MAFQRMGSGSSGGTQACIGRGNVSGSFSLTTSNTSTFTHSGGYQFGFAIFGDYTTFKTTASSASGGTYHFYKGEEEISKTVTANTEIDVSDCDKVQFIISSNGTYTITLGN